MSFQRLIFHLSLPHGQIFFWGAFGQTDGLTADSSLPDSSSKLYCPATKLFNTSRTAPSARTAIHFCRYMHKITTTYLSSFYPSSSWLSTIPQRKRAPTRIQQMQLKVEEIPLLTWCLPTGGRTCSNSFLSVNSQSFGDGMERIRGRNLCRVFERKVWNFKLSI